MFFYTDGNSDNSGNIKYICFNLLKQSFRACSINFNNFYLLVLTKIFNFFYDIQYLLF